MAEKDKVVLSLPTGRELEKHCKYKSSHCEDPQPPSTFAIPATSHPDLHGTRERKQKTTPAKLLGAVDLCGAYLSGLEYSTYYAYI